MPLPSVRIRIRINMDVLEQMPITKLAIERLAYHGRDLWIETAAKNKVGGEGDYYTALMKHEAVTITHGGFGFRIRNDSRSAQGIEYGTQAYHLPSKINWSSVKNPRLGKKGIYIIVPFSHFRQRSATSTVPFGYHIHHGFMSFSQFKQQLPSGLYRVLYKKGKITDADAKANYKRTTFQIGSLKTTTVSQKAHWT